ncbi:hypothetical protein [Micromonospora aurantiaca (nom. illeg.)]|uniref:hypothetical protein n=1 Tax=Micromonospora aurantiaca (nom. illeg.) TaxID=47850 RepID=UPI00161200DE
MGLRRIRTSLVIGFVTLLFGCCMALSRLSGSTLRLIGGGGLLMLACVVRSAIPAPHQLGRLDRPRQPR